MNDSFCSSGRRPRSTPGRRPNLVRRYVFAWPVTYPGEAVEIPLLDLPDWAGNVLDEIRSLLARREPEEAR